MRFLLACRPHLIFFKASVWSKSVLSTLHVHRCLRADEPPTRPSLIHLHPFVPQLLPQWRTHDAKEGKKEEDVYRLIEPLRRETARIPAKHVCLCRGAQRRLEKVKDLVSPLRVQVERGHAWELATVLDHWRVTEVSRLMQGHCEL